MAKVTKLIAAIEAEAPAQAGEMRHALIDRRDTRRQESPDIEDQLTPHAIAKLDSRLQQEAGRNVERVVARGQKAARQVVDDIVAGKKVSADEKTAAAAKMRAYHQNLTEYLSRRHGRERTDWMPDHGVYAKRDRCSENVADEKSRQRDKVRAERDKPTVKPGITRGRR